MWGTCPLQDGPHLRRGTAGVVGGVEGHLQPDQPPLNRRGVAWPVSWVGGVWRVRGRGQGHPTPLSTSHACIWPLSGGKQVESLCVGMVPGRPGPPA